MISENSVIKSKPSMKGVRILVAVWAVAIAGGFGVLESYANTQGRQAMAPALSAPAQKTVLRLFVHPECPCSRATLTELDRVQTACGSKLDTIVEVFAPHTMTEDWAKGDLYRQASAIPGIRVELDRDGEVAKKYGAFTSGQALLYSAEGRLLFSGGITESRGHEGDNAGAEAIKDFVLKGHGSISTSPVFGCALGTH